MNPERVEWNARRKAKHRCTCDECFAAETGYCEQCGVLMVRPPNIGRPEWTKRRFCSRKCLKASTPGPIRPGDDGDRRHGTKNGYGNLGCRCERCRDANTDYCRDHATAGYTRDLCACGNPKVISAASCKSCFISEREPEHGTESRYTSRSCRCRCEACRVASSAARRSRLRALHTGGSAATEVSSSA